MFFDKNYTTICASKYFGEDDIRRLHEKGIFHFGENKVQDFIKKFEGLRDLNLTWHFIGHLQSNKVKDIVDKVDYIHTIDRMSVVKEIEKHAKHKIKCFIQLNLTREPQKSGVYL
ncbi:MAG: YggS family pyridoxal phosphate enzyme, partial [Tenericutes bacterium HGW-Tenericutes-7]